MSDAEVEATFRLVRWPNTDGKPVCPECGGLDAYESRRCNGASRYRCKQCKGDFSITSGTLFASHKLSLRMYLAAIAAFCNEVKGKSMLALSRELGLSYKAAFVLCHKLREAIGEDMKGRRVGGEGRIAETDGAYFGGYIKPANLREQRVDRRLLRNQNGKRKCVVMVRERDGNSVPAVFKTEGNALNWIKSRVMDGTVLNADEAPSWNGLHSRFEMRRINHQEAYSMDDACTNWAESCFSRLRRAELGHHHHIAGAYLLRYAQEASWREDNRKVANGEQVRRLAGLAIPKKESPDFTGYWQRHLTSIANKQPHNVAVSCHGFRRDRHRFLSVK
jgi:transposase-like protein